MMDRCATCKHWGEPLTRFCEDDDSSGLYEDVPDPVLNVRHCEAIPNTWDVTKWDKDGNRVIDAKYANTLAFAKDGSDYMADVYTKAEFGCVMHAPRGEK